MWRYIASFPGLYTSIVDRLKTGGVEGLGTKLRGTCNRFLFIVYLCMRVSVDLHSVVSVFWLWTVCTDCALFNLVRAIIELCNLPHPLPGTWWAVYVSVLLPGCAVLTRTTFPKKPVWGVRVHELTPWNMTLHDARLSPPFLLGPPLSDCLQAKEHLFLRMKGSWEWGHSKFAYRNATSWYLCDRSLPIPSLVPQAFSPQRLSLAVLLLGWGLEWGYSIPTCLFLYSLPSLPSLSSLPPSPPLRASLTF